MTWSTTSDSSSPLTFLLTSWWTNLGYESAVGTDLVEHLQVRPEVKKKEHDEEGTRRVAASTVWVVSQGRLRKFHKDQLRHASERERLIAEESPAPVTPWTFNALEALIERGAFDDHTADLMDKVPSKSQRLAYDRSRTPVPGGHDQEE